MTNSQSVASARSMRNTHESGLFIIGGAADDCLKDFLRLAGGAAANVLILPHASGEPQESAADVVKQLFAIDNSAVVRVVMPGTPFKIDADVTAVYMTGGDQVRLVELLGANGRKQLQHFMRNGGLIGGSSAGAMCMAKEMIAGGMNKPGSELEMGKGFGLVALVIDTHFGERGRFPRVHAAMARHPKIAALGLDEDTAVFISSSAGSNARVYGKGRAWFYEPAQASRVRDSQFASAVVTPLAAGAEYRLSRR